MHKGLIALALGTLALGMAEFQMMGILMELAAAMDVSVARAGHFITAYASGVCVGAAAMLFMRRMRLDRLLLLLAALIVVGNGIAAASQSYYMLVGARFISGLPHGAFFGVGAIVARRLADARHQVSAVTALLSGMSVATVVGVPVGTFVCNHLGWQFAFGLVSLCGLAALISLRLWIPRIDALPDKGFKGQFSFLKNYEPWLIFGGILCAQTGLYCWYSYVEPQLVHDAGYRFADLTWLMAVGGLGMFCGNILAGVLSTRMKPSSDSAAFLTVGAVALVCIYLWGTVRWLDAVLVFVGAAALFGSGSPLQSSIVGYAKGGELLGGACIQVAYNGANAFAAWLGGAVIDATHSYSAPALAGVPLTLLGAVLIWTLYMLHERKHGAPV